MSLLAGLGKGLQGAGQAIGQGLYAYAMAMRDDEIERMRQASIEKRWAKEDARYEQAQVKDESRYKDQQTRDDSRRKEDVDYRNQESNRANAREGRNDEKQNALLIGQALDRLKEDYKESLAEVDANYLDPVTKQANDPTGYAAAIEDARSQFDSTRTSIVQRSGLSADQIDKYGFNMYLPQPTADNGADKTKTEIVTAPPTDDYDKKKWFEDVRKAQPAQSTAMPKPGETKREMAVDYLLNDRGDTTRKPGLLSPETIAQQQERLKQLRESGVQSAYGAAMMPR
ncbi:hypothetical protein ACRN98_21980 [Shewanella oncorhynchi]|uniref:hypothetical protein n=1 Tax=Shewanella TaxID=22 RepID=UPI0021D9CFD1|nr:MULTISPECIES: hypothetical protein [unclassified Shewanella]MCU7965573.1 hypothetical protein [Shewanella sp. SW32]MCU7973631.1 hypothetical protein [Shewanella sp. SW29]MCU8036932.1 hypothetical protein [Shewanella sp. SM69]